MGGAGEAHLPIPAVQRLRVVREALAGKDSFQGHRFERRLHDQRLLVPQLGDGQHDRVERLLPRFDQRSHVQYQRMAAGAPRLCSNCRPSLEKRSGDRFV